MAHHDDLSGDAEMKTDVVTTLEPLIQQEKTHLEHGNSCGFWAPVLLCQSCGFSKCLHLIVCLDIVHVRLSSQPKKAAVTTPVNRVNNNLSLTF